MAIPNYTYLKLKMPGPKGVITVGSSFEHAYECDVECVEHAEAQAEDEALAATLDKMASEALDSTHRHAGSFEPAEYGWAQYSKPKIRTRKTRTLIRVPTHGTRNYYG